MDTTATHLGFRKLGRGWYAGILITLLIHAAIAAMVYVSQVKAAPREEAVRDMMITELVKFAAPRPKYYLPRIVAPPPPTIEQPVIKIAENPNAPPEPVKEAPKPEDAKIDPKLKRALERAQMLKRAAAEEDTEGQLTGSVEGTASSASEGDAYATAIYNAIKKNFVTPTLISDAELERLEVEIRVRIDNDGTLLEPVMAKSSGNQLFDDSCMQAIKATGRVPPPPASVRNTYRRGARIAFGGKDLAR